MKVGQGSDSMSKDDNRLKWAEAMTNAERFSIRKQSIKNTKVIDRRMSLMPA